MSAPNMMQPYPDQMNNISNLHRNQTIAGSASGYHGSRNRDSSGERNRNDYRGRSGYNTPPHPNRQSRFGDISPGVLPLMSPAPPMNIEQQRQNVMAAQQQRQQFNYLRQQQQQQRGHQGRTQPWQQHGYRGQRWSEQLYFKVVETVAASVP